MSIKNDIREILHQTLREAPYNIELSDILLDEPKNLDYGDYATNVALRLTKGLKKAPKVIALELIEKLQASTTLYSFSEQNGFINIKIQDQGVFGNIQNINSQYGDLTIGKDISILLEYVSANPTGPLHIGHGRWAAIGDTLARVLKKCGYSVHKEFYVNDLGNQINNYQKSVTAAKNNQPIPEDGYHGAYIKDIAALNTDPVEYMKQDQARVLALAQVHFDQWFSEKTLNPKLPEILEFLKSKNLTYENEGALWFRSSDYGDDKDRVLVKKDGEKTYFLSDIAYHKNKLDRGYHKLINIWGADHHGYVSRVKAAISAIKGVAKDDGTLTVILGQLVNLFRDGQPVRLSKRTGDMVSLEEVIEEIGADATRYFLARYSTDTTLDFDLTLAKQQSNDNPVFYVQYAHARICSILRQPEVKNINTNPTFSKLEPSERKLLLKLIRFPDELEIIAKTYSIHRLPAFAEETAKLFHGFYHDCRVITDDPQTTAARVEIIKAVKTVIAIILNLLGVSAPEKM